MTSLLRFLGMAALAVLVGLGLGTLVFGQAVPIPRPPITGAPTDATYITQTSNGSLGAEQALASLDTGIMRVATTTGAVTSLTDSAGIAANISDETGSGAVQFAIGTVEANTGAKSPAVTESGEMYTNTGDGDGSSIALLDNPTVGTTYEVAVTVAQTITITPGSGETLKLAGDTCGTSITSNVVGSTLKVKAVVGGAAGSWYVVSSVGTWVCNA